MRSVSDIRFKIRRAITIGGSPEPAVIARELVHEMTDSELRPALEIALPYLVRDEIRKERHKAVGKADPRGAFAWKDEPVREQTPEQRRKRSDGAAKSSVIVRERVDRQQRLLSTPVALGTGQWKRLGECTPEDLRTLATQTRRRHAELVQRADVYDRLAADMEAKGIEKVADYDRAEQVRDAIAA